MNLIPINEGNEECYRCKHFYEAYGCMPTYCNQRPPCGRKVEGDKMGNHEFCERAVKLVYDYTVAHLDKSDKVPEFEVFVVWSVKVLQNNKALLSTTLFDGMYYEITYNGDKQEWYFDAYKKFENMCIPDREALRT